MIVDTHSHINMKQFINDIDDVILNAQANDILKIIVVGMDKEHNLRSIYLSNKYPNLYASVGVHPTSVDTNKVSDIIPLIENNKVVAIGEIGIDLHWRKDNLDLQKKIFAEQIELAIKYNLPIIIHTRNSFKEAYDVLKPYQGKVRGVFHSFSSDLKDAVLAINLGFYIGISGVVTFNKAVELKDVVKNIPLDKVLLETDSPFLSPVPYRGKRNEPAYTKYVAKKVSEIKGIDEKVVKETTTLNAINLFRLE